MFGGLFVLKKYVFYYIMYVKIIKKTVYAACKNCVYKKCIMLIFYMYIFENFDIYTIIIKNKGGCI